MNPPALNSVSAANNAIGGSNNSSSSSTTPISITPALIEKIRQVSTLLIGKSNRLLLNNALGSGGGSSGGGGGGKNSMLLRALSLHNQAVDLLTQYGEYEKAIENFREADNLATIVFDSNNSGKNSVLFEYKVFAIRIRLVCSLHIQDFFLLKPSSSSSSSIMASSATTRDPTSSSSSGSSTPGGSSTPTTTMGQSSKQQHTIAMVREAAQDQLSTLFNKLIMIPEVENALKQELPQDSRSNTKKKESTSTYASSSSSSSSASSSTTSVFRRLSLTSSSAKRRRFLILSELSSIRVALYEILYGDMCTVPSIARNRSGEEQQEEETTMKRTICRLLDNHNHLLDFSCIEPQRLQNSHHETITALIVIGQRLFSGSFDHVIHVYDTQTLNPIALINFERGGGTCCFCYSNEYSNEEDYLFVGLNNGKILVIDLKRLEVIQCLTGHEWAIQCLLVHKGVLYSGSFDKSIRLWALPQQQSTPLQLQTTTTTTTDPKVETPSQTATTATKSTPMITSNGMLFDCVSSVYAMVVVKELHEFFACFADTTIVVWNTETKKWIQTLTGHTATVTQLVVSDVCYGSESENVCDNTQNNGSVSSGTVTPSGTTVGMDRTSLLQSNQRVSMKRRSSEKGSSSTNTVHSSTTTGYQGRLFSAALDQTIRIWSLSSTTAHQCLYTIQLDSGVIGNVSCSMLLLNHDRELWIGSDQGYVQAFDTESYSSIYMNRCYMKKDTRIEALAVSGGKLITCAKDHTIRIQDMTIANNEDRDGVVTVACTRGVDCLLIDDGRVYAGGLTVRSILL